MLNKLIGKFDEGTLELLKHGKNYVSASMLTKGLSIISIPIMTRLLEPSDYGILAVFGTLVAILGIIFGFGIRGAVSRYYYEKTEDFGSFFSTNILFVWVAGIVLSIVAYVNVPAISNLMNIPDNLVVFAIFIAWISTSYALVTAYFQASKQSLLLSRISIAQAVIALILIISITLILKEDLYLGSVYVQTMFASFFFLFSLYIIKKIGTFDFQIKHLKYSLIFGLPLVLHLLSATILNSIDQVMINKMVGSHEAGVYSFAYKVGMLFQMVIVGLNQAWGPIFFEKLRDDKHSDLNVIAKKYAYMVFGVALIVVMFAPLLITILAPKSYAAALPLVPIIIGGFMFQFLYFMYGGYAFNVKKTSIFVFVTIIVGLVNIGLNYWLIPKFGYVASAWTTLISYALFFLLHYINAIYNIKPPQSIPLKTVILPGIFSAILIIIASFSNTYIKSSFSLYAIYFSLIVIYVLPLLRKKRKIFKHEKGSE